jgi:hypothetical protein
MTGWLWGQNETWKRKRQNGSLGRNSQRRRSDMTGLGVVVATAIIVYFLVGLSKPYDNPYDDKKK